MMIDNEYEVGDIVYLKTDEEQLQRIVSGIDIRPGVLIYRVSCGIVDSSHYDFEMTREKSYLVDSEVVEKA